MPAAATVIDERLKEWATPRQCEFIDAINATGSQHGAAKTLGLNQASICRALQRLQVSAALRGYSPNHDMTRVVPEPFIVRGVSTYYDKDGRQGGQWVKSQLDDKRLQLAMRAAVDALAETMPRAAAIKPPAQTAGALLNLYTLTDCHVGMRAWKAETGSDWDLAIAERTLVSLFKHLVKASPRASTAFVNQLGDFLHYDSLLGITPTSGHVLDVDGRYSKVVTTAVRILRTLIDAALARHERVIVGMFEGNHDIAGSGVWLRHLFGLLYENEPRVTVVQTENPFHAQQHGRCMIGFHHGHLVKNQRLPGLFAAQYAPMWGATTKRYIHTGHRHHVEEKEDNGATVIQHPTLAARDSYAMRHGYIAERQATSITYHEDFGQVGRNTVVPEMMEETESHGDSLRS